MRSAFSFIEVTLFLIQFAAAVTVSPMSLAPSERVLSWGHTHLTRSVGKTSVTGPSGELITELWVGDGDQ
jgi:hypothetical protein